MRVPEEWKTVRQIIIETYFIERSPSRVARRLNKDLSYVSRVIRAYKKLPKQKDSVPKPPPSMSQMNRNM